jgi:hypothetical protein
MHLAHRAGREFVMSSEYKSVDPYPIHDDAPERRTGADHLLPTPERYLTIKDAAVTLGIHEWKLQRAVKAGLVSTFTFYNGRQYVRLSEVIAIIEASRRGGRND